MIKSENKSIRQSKLFLAILCSIASSCIHAQTVEQTYSFALQQEQLCNYDVAIKSFKRVQFFDDQNQFPEVFRLLADCYFEKSDYEQSYYYYDLACIQSVNDSATAELTASKISCKLYSHLYQEALIDLLSFNKKLSSTQQWQFNMLYGITYFYLNDYSQSKMYFYKCIDTLNIENYSIISKDFQAIKKLEKRYNPKVAKIMSIIIPGSGQWYAGDFRNGANSFLLISGILISGVAMSSSITFLDATIIILPWFQRYYAGGYKKASIITYNKQVAEKNKILAQLVHSINQDFK